MSFFATKEFLLIGISSETNRNEKSHSGGRWGFDSGYSGVDAQGDGELDRKGERPSDCDTFTEFRGWSYQSQRCRSYDIITMSGNLGHPERSEESRPGLPGKRARYDHNNHNSCMNGVWERFASIIYPIDVGYNGNMNFCLSFLNSTQTFGASAPFQGRSSFKTEVSVGQKFYSPNYI